MPESLTNEGLWEERLSLFESQLGPVQALEFMAMVSRQPFDYQRWQKEQFGGFGIDDILAQAKTQVN